MPDLKRLSYDVEKDALEKQKLSERAGAVAPYLPSLGARRACAFGSNLMERFKTSLGEPEGL